MLREAHARTRDVGYIFFMTRRVSLGASGLGRERLRGPGRVRRCRAGGADVSFTCRLAVRHEARPWQKYPIRTLISSESRGCIHER